MGKENKDIYSKSLTYHAWQRMKKISWHYSV